MSANQDWLRDMKWGIFTHYLYGCQNMPGSERDMGRGETAWSDCVEEFDTEKLADELKSIGAHYLIFTTMQGSQYMCAPNATADRITGYAPGEACARRDLIADLIESLDKRNIALLLYFTGDGFYKDAAKAGPKMGFVEPRKDVSDQFIANWASVLEEYALRYGSGVKGWWVDGCYPYFGYNDQKLKPYADAIRKGNPDALIAFNGGVKQRVAAYSALDNYTCGEMNSFVDLPDSRFLGGAQWHTLAPLGLSPDGSEWGSWCRGGCKHTAGYMRDYVKACNERGGVVSIDVELFRDGHIAPEQRALLEILKDI